MAKGRRSAHAEEGHENNERWLLTYADLITLLMVFFVVMYSMSRADAHKFFKLQVALQRAFRVEVLEGNEPTSLKGVDGSSTDRAVLADSAVVPAPKPAPELITTVDELRAALIQLPEVQRPGGSVQLGTSRDGVVISLSGNVLFDSGRADLKPAGLRLLDVLAQRIRPMPNEVRIEGHTDDIAIATSAYPSNWELSAARATTVARYLATQDGLEPRRLIAAGYGEYRPVASNETREGRARNRRVDIVVIFPSNLGGAMPVTSPVTAEQGSEETAGGTP